MTRLKKMTAFLLSAAVLICCFTVQAAAADANAEKIVAKALKELKNAASISLIYESDTTIVEDNEEYTTHLNGIVISDNKLDYGLWVDRSEDGVAWADYSYRGYIFTKEYNSSSFEKHKDYDYDKNISTEKKFIEYVISNLKNTKITKTTDKYYVISAKSDDKNSQVDRIILTISKATGRLIKYTGHFAVREYSFFDAEDKYTLTDGYEKYSNICYGDTALSLPDEIKKML